MGEVDLPRDDGSAVIGKALGSSSEDGEAGELLPGELSGARDREDIEHWITVYSELACSARSLYGRDDHVDRYRRRLAFWLRRREESASRRFQA